MRPDFGPLPRIVAINRTHPIDIPAIMESIPRALRADHVEYGT